MTRPAPLPQQTQSLPRSTVTRQDPNSQIILETVKLGLARSELVTRPASQSLVVKLSLSSSRITVPQQNPISQSIPLKAPQCRLTKFRRSWADMTDSEVAVLSDEARLPGPRAGGTTSAADDTAVAQSTDEAGCAQNRTTTESARAVSSCEAGAAAAVARSTEEARPPRFRACSATTESDLVPAWRVEQAVAKPSEEVTLCQYTRLRACAREVFTRPVPQQQQLQILPS